jgi:hypothetical protein
MRRILSGTAFCVAFAALSVPAFAGDDDSGTAMQQLQNATSGHQTLSTTYGDNGKGETCPNACPDGSNAGNVPEPPPPTPVGNTSDDPNGGQP